MPSIPETDWFVPVALGMQSRLIINSQLDVSSFKDSTSGPDKARLNVNATAQSITTTRSEITVVNATMNVTINVTMVDAFYVEHGGWIAADGDNNPWLQVDFRTNVTITAVVTQGLDSGFAWVTNYSLAYGQDKDHVKNYSVEGEVRVCLINCMIPHVYFCTVIAFKTFLTRRRMNFRSCVKLNSIAA